MNKTPKIQSAIGHDGAAEAMSLILGTEVKVNRIQAAPQPGDIAISLKLKGRLPEGVILTAQEMEEIGFELYLLEFFSMDTILTTTSHLDQLSTDSYNDGMYGQGLVGFVSQNEKPLGYPKYQISSLVQ